MARKKMRAEENETVIDMTPMIDCIFLLLIFFMLTSKFQPEEKQITNLLPTNKGQTGVSTSKVIPQQINIALYPAGLPKGLQPSEYWNTVQQMQAADPILSKCALRVGGGQELVIDRTKLLQKDSPELRELIAQIHQYISQEIAARDQAEAAPSRDKLTPIVIHCYSSLSWQYAVLAYDAVRAYEAAQGAIAKRPSDLETAREVTFAPPRVRNYDTKYPLGNELFEIVNVK